MVTGTTALGERGLLRLPAAIRDDAELEQGQELIMISEGPGRVTLTTRRAIQAEVWAAAAPEPDGPDAVEDVRQFRAADRAHSDEKYGHASGPAGDVGPNPAGDELLQALGL